MHVILDRISPVYEEPSERPEQKLVDESRLSLYSLPSETLSKVFEYMSHEDCDKFIELSKHATSMPNNGFVLDWHVSAHIFIQSKRLNQLFAFELSRYFNSQTRISDADACDQYELACLDGLNEYRGIPAYLVQSFIHESLWIGFSNPHQIVTMEMMLYWRLLMIKLANMKNVWSVHSNGTKIDQWKLCWLIISPNET